jgi:hypothetical protein
VDGQVRHHQTLGAVLIRRTLYWATMRDPAGREYCLTARNPDTGVRGDLPKGRLSLGLGLVKR